MFESFFAVESEVNQVSDLMLQFVMRTDVFVCDTGLYLILEVSERCFCAHCTDYGSRHVCVVGVRGKPFHCLLAGAL